MVKRICVLIATALCAAALVACAGVDAHKGATSLNVTGQGVSQAEAATSAGTVKVKVGKKKFKLKLAGNKAAKAFKKYLKKTRKLKMSELNGNEKYHYFSTKTFPTNEKSVKTIHAGDVMLYGDDCLVVFYKTFKTSYSYTKIGKLTSTKGLKKAVGKGSVTMKFYKAGK